jgi:isopropylmalate/homocitrate/citramalate synthase
VIALCDVAPRDGLQNEATALSPATRAELCVRLAEAGLPRVEAVSFARDDRVPRMAGAETVLAALDAGATLFESSVGGAGGCPFAPGPRATSPPRTSELDRPLSGALSRPGCTTGGTP